VTAPLKVVRRGEGPPIVFVHGSAADHGTWMMQLATPLPGFSSVAYDRRGAPSAPFSPGQVPTTEAHVADLVALLGAEAPGPALVVGSSYGAVVSLAAAAACPERLAGLVLCEPPLPMDDLVPGSPAGFGCAFDRLVATAGGEAAAEMFLRAVLGSRAFDAAPARLRQNMLALWRSIRADMIALGRLRLRYGELGGVRVPCLLLSGARSPAFYTAPLDTLERALPSARREVIPSAGHAMHLENPRAFGQAVAGFARAIGYGPG
jgi:pimeloyl-ACP methyl ester carboxylesterase